MPAVSEISYVRMPVFPGPAHKNLNELGIESNHSRQLEVIEGEALSPMKNSHVMPKLLIMALCWLMVPSTPMAESNPPVERQFDMYWAKRRDIKNIHKRLFLKEGRHEFSVVGGVIPNDDFFTYFPVGVKYNYFFSEDLAMEFAGSYMPHKKSDLQNFLEKDVLQDPEAVKVFLPQFLEYQAGVGVLWTPLHGKLAIFSTKLGHFDFGIAMGVMALGTQVKKEGKSGERQRRVDVGGNVGATGKLYVTDYLALRVDYRHYFYAARDADDNTRGLSYPAEITFGVSFFTSAPQ